MRIPNAQVVKFALTPGAAEEFEVYARSVKNTKWLGIAKGVKHSRNALYLGVALTAIAAAGIAFSDAENKTCRCLCGTVAAVGVGLAGLAAKRLYSAISYFRE